MENSSYLVLKKIVLTRYILSNISANIVVTQSDLSLANEYNVGEIIVGNPLNMNGTAGPRSELCHEVADMIREKTPIEVKMWDERQTTVTAIGILNQTDTRGKKRKAVIDTVAATIILENYLAYRKNHKQ